MSKATGLAPCAAIPGVRATRTLPLPPRADVRDVRDVRNMPQPFIFARPRRFVRAMPPSGRGNVPVAPCALHSMPSVRTPTKTTAQPIPLRISVDSVDSVVMSKATEFAPCAAMPAVRATRTLPLPPHADVRDVRGRARRAQHTSAFCVRAPHRSPTRYALIWEGQRPRCPMRGHARGPGNEDVAPPAARPRLSTLKLNS